MKIGSQNPRPVAENATRAGHPRELRLVKGWASPQTEPALSAAEGLSAATSDTMFVPPAKESKGRGIPVLFLSQVLQTQSESVAQNPQVRDGVLVVFMRLHTKTSILDRYNKGIAGGMDRSIGNQVPFAARLEGYN